MKIIKKISICLLSLALLAIMPIANIFADEGDSYSIMPIGQPITQDFYRTTYTTYRDGTSGYEVQFKLNITYERSQNGSKWYARDVVINSCTSGVNDNLGPQGGTHKARAVSASCRIDNTGSRPYAVVTATVSEYVNGLGTTNRNFTYRFAL